MLVCSNIVPITPQYVHLVVSSGGKYNHILAKFWVEISAGPSAPFPVQGTRFGFVGVRFLILAQTAVSKTPACVGLGKVRLYSNRLGEISNRLRTEEVSRV